MTLLIVDDEPQIRIAMQAFFQKNPMGFADVLSAADGISALKLIEARSLRSLFPMWFCRA